MPCWDRGSGPVLRCDNRSVVSRRLFGAVLVSLTACGNQAPPPDTASRATVALQDTLAPFLGTLEPVHQPWRGQPGEPTILHSAATAARELGFDRLTFVFTGERMPGYRIAYTPAPIRHCGSGDLVPIAGTGVLVVRFEPAQAHDDQGRPTITDRAWAPALPAIKEVKLVCDFEGQIEWAVGLAARRRFRVLEAAAPARLLVDVRHRD